MINKSAKVNFLKEIILLAGNDIFDNFNHKEYERYLEVPIDIVIRKIYCKLFSLENPSKIISKKYDKRIIDFSKELFPELPILLDDIWFWGHFTFVRDKFKVNEAMLYCDINIDENFISDCKINSKLKKFIEVVKCFGKFHCRNKK